MGDQDGAYNALQSTDKRAKSTEEVANPLNEFCCLSPIVSKLILISKDQNKNITSDQYEYFGLNRRLNWEKVTKENLLKNTDFPPSSDIWAGVFDRDWFTASLNVQKMSLEASSIMGNSSIEEIRQIYKNGWIGITIVRIHEAFLETQNALFGLAAICPLLERILGDVFASWEESHQLNAKLRRKPPPLVKDLLQTEELKKVLGADTLFLLQVLIGSPRSLNLRNIIWHGFASPHEIHSGYYWLLLILFLDIIDRGLVPPFDTSSSLSSTSLLTLPGENPIILKSRELKDMSIIPPESYDFGLGSMSILSRYQNNSDGILPDSEERLKSEILSLIEKSTFILPGRGEMVKKSLDLFANGERDNFAYYMCLVNLLPALEHCLRAVWIKSNALPSILLYADSYRYYTILDMFIDPNIHDEIISIESLTTVDQMNLNDSLAISSTSDTPASSDNYSSIHTVSTFIEKISSSESNEKRKSENMSFSSQSTLMTEPRDSNGTNANEKAKRIIKSRKNKLVEEIGINIMIALNDVFLYPFGPRPRDRISHGDVNPEKVTRSAAARCLEMFFAIAMRYLPKNETCDNLNNGLRYLKECERYFESYVACWHPHALLERQIHETVFSTWRRWKSIILSIPMSNSDTISDDDIIRRREGYHEEMDGVMAIISKISNIRPEIHNPMAKWISIDMNILYSDEMREKESDPDRLTLTWYNSFGENQNLASATFDSLRKVLFELDMVIETWCDRFENQKSMIEAKEATTRLETTFWKQLALLNLATLFFSASLSFYESRLHLGPLPPKLIRKLATATSQFRQKVSQNSWDEIALGIAQTTSILVELC